MEAVAVVSEPMTHRQAEDALKEWQAKLDAARQALADGEANIGQLALAQGADKATAQITRLQVEVRMNEAGLAAAQVQRDEAQRREQLARIVQLRAKWEELNEEAGRHGAIIREWGPKVSQAHESINLVSLQMSTIERQIEEIERKYGQAVPA